jgi:hypothetical protein
LKEFSGCDRYGRKRHLSVDLLWLVLWVLVTFASLLEYQGAKQVHDKGNQVSFVLGLNPHYKTSLRIILKYPLTMQPDSENATR